MKKKILAIQGSSLKKINIKTDTSFFLGLEAQKRNYDIYYYEPRDLTFVDGKVIARCCHVKFKNNLKKPIKILKKCILNLIETNLLLIRNEPPFNQQYINTTFILEHISKKIKIINDPRALREVPEKLFSLRLTKFMPSTLISEDLREIKKFFDKNKKVIIKPLESYSGNDVKLLNKFNKGQVTRYIKKYHHLMFQKFIPQISKGDKRVFIIDGKVKGAISRLPERGSILSNMSKGASAKKIKITNQELKISKIVASELKRKNIYFAGIDFIKGKLIGDINVTSPTGLKTYYDLTGINLAEYFFDNI
ncbi:MAG: glutathione synthase [Pelagibacterales bacterium]|jgi:glutathione synthase|nr:glutathione synthase [Pelagibacterales bacterium]